MEQQQSQEVKKEFKPKPWLKKPAGEKKVQCYYYVKAKYKEIAEREVNYIIKNYK